MRKLIVCLALAALAAIGGTSVAAAAPGPNGRNDYGLCKAYFAGSDTGKENKRSKGPFPALVEKAGDQDGDGDTDEDDVAAYCESVYPGGKSSAPGKRAAKKRAASRKSVTRTTSVTRLASL